MTTVVVIPVVTMSSRRRNNDHNERADAEQDCEAYWRKREKQRYGKHNAKLTQVTISRAIPAESAWARLS